MRWNVINRDEYFESIYDPYNRALCHHEPHIRMDPFIGPLLVWSNDGRCDKSEISLQRTREGGE